VTARLLQDALLIEVCDNGPGFPAGFPVGFPLAPAAPNGSGHGLRNVAERLRGYYDDSAHLAWECGAEGTRVLTRIPQ
jgi:LytS/YehU family sensor histidine kinase